MHAHLSMMHILRLTIRAYFTAPNLQIIFYFKYSVMFRDTIYDYCLCIFIAGKKPLRLKVHTMQTLFFVLFWQCLLLSST